MLHRNDASTALALADVNNATRELVARRDLATSRLVDLGTHWRRIEAPIRGVRVALRDAHDRTAVCVTPTSLEADPLRVQLRQMGSLLVILEHECHDRLARAPVTRKTP
jgi:hypothetical protein